MKLLFASDSFKGSLSSHQTIELLTKAAKDVFGKCQCEGFEVADGGEGTVDAVVKAVDGEKVTVSVHGPQMEVVNASYGGIEKKKAILGWLRHQVYCWFHWKNKIRYMLHLMELVK